MANPNYKCPKCGQISLTFSEEGNYYHCTNPSCNYYASGNSLTFCPHCGEPLYLDVDGPVCLECYDENFHVLYK